MSRLDLLRWRPSLAAAFALIGALVVATLLATIALVSVTAGDLDESNAPGEALARLRHESLASSIFDREALLAPPSEKKHAEAEARSQHAHVRRLLDAIPAVCDLEPDERALYLQAEAGWRSREQLAHAAFELPEPTSPADARARWALHEELARSTHAFNDRLQDLARAMQRGTRRVARTLRITALVLSALTLIILPGGALFIRDMVIRPLRRLLDAEESVARGRLDVRVPLDGLAEVREISYGFNEMIASLRARHEEVKQKQALLGRRERALHRRNRELAAANGELDAFAYAASHDLRAPLRGIESMARFLWEDVGEKLDPEARDKLDRIRRAARRLHLLIDSLFEVARAGRDLGAVEDVPLSECVADALDALQGPLREARGEVHVEPDLPVVRGDRTRLTQVLQNLIGNAIKYSSGKDRTPRIEIGARVEGAGVGGAAAPGPPRDREGDGAAGAPDGGPRRSQPSGSVVALFVRDNGIGIPEDQHQRIFQLFRRLHRDDEYEGTGVGLSIVQRVVHAHGGSVSVASTPGEGACFTIRLPRYPPRALPGQARGPSPGIREEAA
jgi:signal transduction histidine kinase